MQKRGEVSREYSEVFLEYPRITAFLDSRTPVSVRKLESTWRKSNLILHVACENGDYVFKQLNDGRKLDEIDRMNLMGAHYPALVPKMYLHEGNAYLMQYVQGKSFFGLSEEEKPDRVNQAGRVLVTSWNGQAFPRKDISPEIQALFNKYRTKSARFFADPELRAVDLSNFTQVPQQPSHNDLNAANILYGSGVSLIDPSDEGYEDTARDVGRYLASVFFNQYDYYGNDARASLDLAQAFLCNFSPETLERARFYIGESFMAFMNFPTVSTPKDVLKKLAILVLESGKPILTCLEEGLKCGK